MCKCQNCLAFKKHNRIAMSDQLQADTPAARAIARLKSVMWLCLSFVKFVGLFFVGIMVGGGIVLRNPPQDKKAMQQIVELKKENQAISSELQNVTKMSPAKNLIVKDTINLP